MDGMRDEYLKLQDYNDQLLNERSVLAKRAAVGFGALTPRPNFPKLFSAHGKILLVGANGNIGKELTKFLIKYYEVYCLIRSAPTFAINSIFLRLISFHSYGATRGPNGQYYWEQPGFHNAALGKAHAEAVAAIVASSVLYTAIYLQRYEKGEGEVIAKKEVSL
ncbi:unnamed protein product [Sphagnum balticum]